MKECTVGKGRENEKLAADYLASRGYAIREMNWRPKPAPYEVDIIAQKGADIVFVEVKSRKDSDPVTALEAVDLKKQKFIARAADMYLRQQPRMYYYRFDIITISGPERRIVHIEDAFMPPLSGVGCR